MITPDITRLSPNKTNAPITGKTVIIHCTRSGTSMNPTELIGTLNFMSRVSSQVSSHWVVGREGELARVVPDNQQAWHAQEDNDNCWGIEVCQGVESDGFTEIQLASLVQVCKGYMADFGVPAVHTTNSGQPGFIGHQETAQGRRNGKSDPGRLFSWDQFIQALKSEVEEDALNPVWAAWDSRPDHIPFRSYLLFATPGGLKSKHVASEAEHTALANSGVAGDLKDVPLWTLREFGCTPDPEEG